MLAEVFHTCAERNSRVGPQLSAVELHYVFSSFLLGFWSDRRDAFNKSVCVCVETGEEGATQQDAFFHIISR